MKMTLLWAVDTDTIMMILAYLACAKQSVKTFFNVTLESQA